MEGIFFLKLVWLIPLIPLASFWIIVLFANPSKKLSHSIAIGSIALAWILSWGALYEGIKHHVGRGEEAFHMSWNWLPTGPSWFRMGVMVDPLTLAMLFMVPFVCLLIFIYSIGYMHGDPRYSRFFAYISLFACGMLGMVLADNLLMLMIFWEVMGLCSYLLIGFWFEKPSAMRAGLKAFITTRIGDVMMLLGIIYLYSRTGSLTYSEVFKPEVRKHLAHSPVPLPLVGELPVATVIAILLFGGAVGKSAQFPLHVWLPDAMEGPTPVSALIHAATMVAAGVYLVARSFPLFSVVEHGPQLGLVAFIGAFTAFFASTIAIAQNDIKRVLAYSTISQLGYMIAALGVGAYVAAVFHLITHAFFKALLFLGSGSVIIGTHHEMDMMRMGGLRKRMPITFWTFLMGTLALAGIPPWAGFWSKDEILGHAFHHASEVGFLSWPGFVWVLGTLAAFLTAFYMGRQVFLTFAGEPRSHHAEEAHETPWVMTIPLIILAFFSTFLGFVGVPHDFPVLGPLLNNPFHHLVGEGFPTVPLNFGVMGLSVLMGLAGLALSWVVYGREPLRAGQPDPLSISLGPIYTVLKNKYYIDEFYQATVIRFALWLSETFFKFDDHWVIDPIVDGVGRLGRKLSDLGGLFDLKVVDGIVNGLGKVTSAFGGVLRLTQTGKAQNYLLVAVLTVLMLLGIYIVRF